MNPIKLLKEKFLYLSRVQKVLLSLLFVSLLALSLWAGYQLGYKKWVIKDEALSPRGTIVSGKPEEPTDFPNPINGVLFKKSEAEVWVNRLPIAVIIENHTQARPQSGLSKAEVIYEALAEGGITRFLAVFLREDTKVGPVRSNRPYYLDWVSEYDAVYAHVGGSPAGQAKVKEYAIKDLDQFYNSSAYHREPKAGISTEHTMYSSTDLLRATAEKKGYKKENEITSWKFLEEKDLPKREARVNNYNINLGFLGTFKMDVEWRYNADTNSYFRFNGGEPMTDATTNTQIEVKTVAVQTVNKSNDPSGKGRLFMDTVGSGIAKVFVNGTMIEGSWKKDSRTGRTKFLDSAGNEIKLNRGKIWVEIIPPGSTFTHT